MGQYIIGLTLSPSLLSLSHTRTNKQTQFFATFQLWLLLVLLVGISTAAVPSGVNDDRSLQRKRLRRRRPQRKLKPKSSKMKLKISKKKKKKNNVPSIAPVAPTAPTPAPVKLQTAGPLVRPNPAQFIANPAQFIGIIANNPAQFVATIKE